MPLIVAIFDKKAESYHGGLHLAQSANAAVRMFRETIRQDDGMLKRYPEDFALHQLGVLDEANGIVEASVTLLEEALASVRFVNGGDENGVSES